MKVIQLHSRDYTLQNQLWALQNAHIGAKMKTTLLILLFVCTLLNAQQSVLMLGELKIFGLNIPQEVELTFETEKVPSTSHWDFQNNLVLNSYYTYQNFTLSYSNTYDSFWFRTGETTGMGKGLYKVTAKNSNDSLLAYFYYDLRTCIDYNNKNVFCIIFFFYRSFVYSGGPDGFDQIATLGRNATSYYDSEYFTGTGAIAYYQIRKRNVYKNSVPSNTVSINIIPAKMTEA